MSHSFSVSNISNLPVQATISNLGISNLRFTDDFSSTPEQYVAE